MKKIFVSTVLAAFLFTSIASCAQGDKSKRPSPPAKATATLASGTLVTIDYSQPSVKGRTIGKDIEPKEGQVWRTGANEATIFEVSKAVKVNGKDLAAGKYALFTLVKGGEWTVIFNKTWSQWGAYDYKSADDALTVKATATKSTTLSEKMTFSVDKNGTIDLFWGDNKVTFIVE